MIFNLISGMFRNVPFFSFYSIIIICLLLNRFRELSFGDKVFYDLNADGVQAGDSSEPGIANVVVQLVLQSDGSVLATTTTDANGNYLFTASDSLAIEPGTAFIVSIVPSDNVALNGTLLSLADAGADDTVDSDAADINDGASAQVQLTLGAWGTVDLDVADFGFQPFLEIGDYGKKKIGCFFCVTINFFFFLIKFGLM